MVRGPGPTALNTTAGIQYWTVPSTGIYRITTYGASGASPAAPTLALGAKATGDVYLIKGTVLKVLVGQLGSITNTASYYNPGGGGTFVTLLDNTPLIIAGGGGGQGSGATPSSSYAPTTTTTLPSGTVVAGYDVSGALATAGGSGA